MKKYKGLSREEWEDKVAMEEYGVCYEDLNEDEKEEVWFFVWDLLGLKPQ